MPRLSPLKRKLKCALCFFLSLTLLLVTVLAAAPIDPEAEAALTLTFQPEGSPAVGTQFRIYRIAELDAQENVTLLPPFDQYPVQIGGREDWPKNASTLEAYVSGTVQPTAVATIGQDGTAAFTGLDCGLYLVSGNACAMNQHIYIPQPAIISLPTMDESGQWDYHVSARIKYIEQRDSSRPSYTQIKAVKTWLDEGYEEKRPDEVTVQLLKNGKVHDTVTLSADNNWRHTWTRLSRSSTWQVVEQEVPEGYTVAITREAAGVFVVTNTYQPEEPPPTTPEEPDKPDEPNTPDNPDHPEKPDRPVEPDPKPGEPEHPGADGEKLPQSGVLWWPVPVLAVSGMALFLIGWLRRREHGDED